ncbi:MAG: DMT family transporter [Rhizobiales bacterium]|nr:DMT family transporter [Hyphomicrobiales bacterium]
MKTETLAKIACAYSGMVWGLFWIPLRTLEAAGITGLWATLVFYAAPIVLASPILIWRWREFIAGGAGLQLTGILSAFGLVLYSVSVLYTDIVKAILLFYLTPIWSTLLGRVVLGETITPVRWLAMALGLIGIVVIFGLDSGLPLPRNLGDWLALASGIMWAITAVRLRRETNNAIELSNVNFLWSFVFALAFLLIANQTPMPDWATAIPSLPWWMILMLIAIVSGPVTSIWGAKYLSPGIVGLLFMTEISVGAVTAALWSGEPFGWREVAGIVLISSAGVLESLWELWRDRKRPAAV